MRQAGLKPKSHSSGTYWIRANANRAINKGDGGTMLPKVKSTFQNLLEWLICLFILLYVVVALAQ